MADAAEERADLAEGGTSGIADEHDAGGIADKADHGTDGQGIADESGQQKGDACGTRKESGKDKTQEPYVLSAPADFPLPDANLKSFSDACNRLGLSREQAEGMLNWHKEFHDAVSGEAQQHAASTIATWQAEILADREFGGGRLKETVADARKALAAFDPDGALRALLRESRYQHHPAVIRAVARIGRAMGEHEFIGVNGESGKAKTPLEERLYKNMNVEG